MRIYAMHKLMGLMAISCQSCEGHEFVEEEGGLDIENLKGRSVRLLRYQCEACQNKGKYHLSEDMMGAVLGVIG